MCTCVRACVLVYMHCSNPCFPSCTCYCVCSRPHSERKRLKAVLGPQIREECRFMSHQQLLAHFYSRSRITQTPKKSDLRRYVWSE
jgi:hypothetical protein